MWTRKGCVEIEKKQTEPQSHLMWSQDSKWNNHVLCLVQSKWKRCHKHGSMIQTPPLGSIHTGSTVCLSTSEWDDQLLELNRRLMEEVQEQGRKGQGWSWTTQKGRGGEEVWLGACGGGRGGRWGCECVVVVEMMWMEEKEGEEMEELGKEWKEINQSNENWIGEKILKMIDGNEEQEWKRGEKEGMRNEMMCGNSHNTHSHHSSCHELKTFKHISENEGRECGSETMHACERFKYDCGQSDSNDGRTSRVVIPFNSSPISILFIISE